MEAQTETKDEKERKAQPCDKVKKFGDKNHRADQFIFEFIIENSNGIFGKVLSLSFGFNGFTCRKIHFV